MNKVRKQVNAAKNKGLSQMEIAYMREIARKEAEKFIAHFETEDIQVLNGRFGAYIKHGGENYKIPKGTDPKTLDAAACLEIISNTKPSGSKAKKSKK